MTHTPGRDIDDEARSLFAQLPPARPESQVGTPFDTPRWRRLLGLDAGLEMREVEFVVNRPPVMTCLWTGRASLVTENLARSLTGVLRILGVTRAEPPPLLAGAVGGFANRVLSHADGGELYGAMLKRTAEAAQSADAELVVFPFVDSNVAAGLAQASEGRVLCVAVDPSAHIDLPHSTFRQHIEALPRKRRQTIRNELARLKTSGATIELLDVNSSADAVARLIHAVRTGHGLPGDAEDVRVFLRHLGESLEDAAQTILCVQAGLPVAACVLLTGATTMVAYKVGLDYSRARSIAAYFNVVFYTPIHIGTLLGRSSLDLGPGALNAKLLRGALVESRWFVVAPLTSRPLQRRRLRFWNRLQYRRLRETLARYGHQPSEADTAMFESSIT